MGAVLEQTFLDKVLSKPIPEGNLRCLGCGQRVCTNCKECHEDGCQFEGKYVVQAHHLTNFPALQVKSQKARGYVALAESEHLRDFVPRPYVALSHPAMVGGVREKMVTALGTIRNKRAGFKNALFVRPCPTRPRHGFVESRPIELENISEEVLKVLNEARAVDPEAELLVLPHIDAQFNMVVTPHQMTIGQGHDGATAGKETITVPLAGVLFGDTPKSLYKLAGVDLEKEDPYFEAVSVKQRAHVLAMFYPSLLTQLRAGPKVPLSVDYIPAPTVVKSIIHAEGDLVEWERITADLPLGTVAVHVGGSLVSHYGVHCYLNRIPIMTSRIPKIGETLVPTEKVGEVDHGAVLLGLGAAVRLPLWHLHPPKKESELERSLSTTEAVRVMLYGLHNAKALVGRDAFWAGLSAGLMVRLGMMASHGEARHGEGGGGGTREYVFDLVKEDFFKSRAHLGHANFVFKKIKKDGGVGGPRWVECTDSIIALDKAIRWYILSPDQGWFKVMMAGLNTAINKAHNNGWWMNKFCDQSSFDSASKQNVGFLIQLAEPLYIVQQWQVGAQKECIGAYSEWAKQVNIVEPKTKEEHQYVRYVLDPEALKTLELKKQAEKEKEEFKAKQLAEKQAKYHAQLEAMNKPCEIEGCKCKLGLAALAAELFPQSMSYEKSVGTTNGQAQKA